MLYRKWVLSKWSQKNKCEESNGEDSSGETKQIKDKTLESNIPGIRPIDEKGFILIKISNHVAIGLTTLRKQREKIF